MIRYWLPALDLLLLAGALLSLYLSRGPRETAKAPAPAPVADDPTGPATLRTAPPALLYAGPAAGGLVLRHRGRVRCYLRQRAA